MAPPPIAAMPMREHHGGIDPKILENSFATFHPSRETPALKKLTIQRNRTELINTCFILYRENEYKPTGT
jgi:hypothetical protein